MVEKFEKLLEWFLIKTKGMLIWKHAMYLNLEPGIPDPKNGQTLQYLRLYSRWGALAQISIDNELIWRARFSPDNEDPLYIRTEDFNENEFPDIKHFGAHILEEDYTTFCLRQAALEAQTEYDKSNTWIKRTVRRLSGGNDEFQ